MLNVFNTAVRIVLCGQSTENISTCRHSDGFTRSRYVRPNAPSAHDCLRGTTCVGIKAGYRLSDPGLSLIHI